MVRSSPEKKVIVAITGASGALIGERLVRHLLEGGHEVHAVLSAGGAAVFSEEIRVKLGHEPLEIRSRIMRHFAHMPRLQVWAADDFSAKISSGSAPIDAMVVAPCSMSTAAAIAHGITLNLVHRAAGVTIKERRPLVLVPRESPLSVIHLRNLTTLAEIGVHVVPATTAFYHRPKSVEEMVDFTIGRVLDILKIEHRLFRRWRDESSAE